MKRTYPDLESTLRSQFLSNVATVRRFVKYWGTDIVDGVEVLKGRQYYYPVSRRAENFEKLFKLLGYYDQLATVNRHDYKGIDKAWIYLNQNKATDLSAIIEEHNLKGFITDNLNTLWWDPTDGELPEDLTLTALIVIEDLIAAEGSTSSLLNPNQPKELLTATITENYNTLWDTCKISQQGVGVINKGSIIDEVTKVETPDEDDLSPNDPWLKVLAISALKANGPPCTIKDVRIGLGKTTEGRLYNTYAVTLEIPYFLFTENSAFVDDIEDALAASYTFKEVYTTNRLNPLYIKNSVLAMSIADLEDDPSLITRNYVLWETFAATAVKNSSLWLRGRLKADPMLHPRNYGLTFKEMNNYFLPLIDMDVKKEKASILGAIVAVIIAIVAVVLAFFTAGASLSLLNVAYAILAVSILLTVMSLAAHAIGRDDWAMACSAGNKMIEPLVLLASIYLIVTATLQSLAAQATTPTTTTAAGAAPAVEAVPAGTTGITAPAATSAAPTVTTSATPAAATPAAAPATEMSFVELLDVSVDVLANMTIDSAIELVRDLAVDYVTNIVQGVTDFFTGTISAPSVKFVKNSIKLYTMDQQNKLEEIQSRNKDLKAENEDLIKEMYAQTDVLAKYMQGYSKPATLDWSLYAATYDLPYEQSQTSMHTGNVQRTMVQAVRRADYKTDPVNAAVFANTLIM